MVIANLKDGRTQAFNLTSQPEQEELDRLLQVNLVSALSLHNAATQHTLTSPKKFSSTPVFGAELLFDTAGSAVGESIFVQADSVRVVLSLMFTSKLVRCDLLKTGSLLYNPRRKVGRR